MTRVEGAAEGRLVNNLPDYTASFFVNYTIPSGILKQVSFGAGTTFVGATIIGNQVGKPFE